MSKDVLYHYCNNIKAFNILENRTLRLSDIAKSNDYLELKLLFPEIIDAIYDEYKKEPFSLLYNGQRNLEALKILLEEIESYFNYGFRDGRTSNFALCFSEEDDMLSQWRGHADNGKGICVGFDRNSIFNYVKTNKRVLSLCKIKYIDPNKDVSQIVNNFARDYLKEIQGLREWIVKNMTNDDNDPETDSLLSYNISGGIESILTDSLHYKLNGFKEEREWRIHLKSSHFTNPEWIFLKENKNIDDLYGPIGFKETISLLNGKMEFNIMNDDLVPFFLFL